MQRFRLVTATAFFLIGAVAMSGGCGSPTTNPINEVTEKEKDQDKNKQKENDKELKKVRSDKDPDSKKVPPR